jgi:hypothetical protein
MIKKKDKIDNYYSCLRPTQYSVVVCLTLTQEIGDEGICEQNMSLIMQKEFGEAGACLQLKFFGVRNLVLQQPPWSLVSIGHIEILLGSECPNIESNYLVRDPEQERIIWFECRDFDACVEESV